MLRVTQAVAIAVVCGASTLGCSAYGSLQWLVAALEVLILGGFCALGSRSCFPGLQSFQQWSKVVDIIWHAG